MHGTAPPATLGGGSWPADAPAQLHYAQGDPYLDSAGTDAVQRSARDAGASFEVFIYPGDGHLFADPEGPDFDEASAKLMLDRELDFLAKLEA